MNCNTKNIMRPPEYRIKNKINQVISRLSIHWTYCECFGYQQLGNLSILLSKARTLAPMLRLAQWPCRRWGLVAESCILPSALQFCVDQHKKPEKYGGASEGFQFSENVQVGSWKCDRYCKQLERLLPRKPNAFEDPFPHLTCNKLDKLSLPEDVALASHIFPAHLLAVIPKRKRFNVRVTSIFNFSRLWRLPLAIWVTRSSFSPSEVHVCKFRTFEDFMKTWWSMEAYCFWNTRGLGLANGRDNKAVVMTNYRST